MSKWASPEGREGEVARMPDTAASGGRVPASEWSTWVRKLGRQQRRLREFLGLSQDQVAKLGGVSQGAVSRLETARGLATPMLIVLKVNAALAHEFQRLRPTLAGPELREAIELHAALSPFAGALGLQDIPRLDDPQLEELVRLYRQTPLRHREAVLSVVRALVTGLTRSALIALVAISPA
jgi:transcriptional regulator with XRE-family HTH domain